MKILLIEDELSVSSFIKRGLEEQGNTVLQAFDGTTGLKFAFQEEFDVIILDVVDSNIHVFFQEGRYRILVASQM